MQNNNVPKIVHCSYCTIFVLLAKKYIENAVKNIFLYSQMAQATVDTKTKIPVCF
jgi:hypothetical protein